MRQPERSVAMAGHSFSRNCRFSRTVMNNYETIDSREEEFAIHNEEGEYNGLTTSS